MIKHQWQRVALLARDKTLRTVVWHDLKMSLARWLLRSCGYDLDSLVQLSESTIYEELVRIAWTIDGRCTLLEWRAAARARRKSVVDAMTRHRRSLGRLTR